VPIVLSEDERAELVRRAKGAGALAGRPGPAGPGVARSHGGPAATGGGDPAEHNSGPDDRAVAVGS